MNQAQSATRQPHPIVWLILYIPFGALSGFVTVARTFPATIQMYIVWNMRYAFGVGLSYAAFTAMVLSVIGRSAAAMGYNVFASLSNFPIWWLGLLLGWVADHRGPSVMLFAEAVLGVLGVFVFMAIGRMIRPGASAKPMV